MTVPLGRGALVAAVLVGAGLVGGAWKSNDRAEELDRPTAARALAVGHRIEARDLAIPEGCGVEGLGACDDLESRVSVEAIAKGAQVTAADTIALPASRTIVPIALGERAAVAEPFAAGTDVRVVLSPLPDTTAEPGTVDAIVLAQESDPDRVLVALTPSGLDAYRELAGRSRIDVLAAG